MVQPFGFRFIQVTAEENFGRTALIKTSLLNVVLSEPTTISLVEPDPGTLSPRTFVAHCSFRFASGSTPMWPNGRGMSSILHHGTLNRIGWFPNIKVLDVASYFALGARTLPDCGLFYQP